MTADMLIETQADGIKGRIWFSINRDTRREHKNQQQENEAIIPFHTSAPTKTRVINYQTLLSLQRAIYALINLNKWSIVRHLVPSRSIE
ncbi:hypothetical protein Haur_2618 [Herpetosiphon aurantiacus DSM 785]|uniref:Uncharacterized protein n=1 Tax=Herpetosiphon aurantiacus (strain ATCC 23779 / DSM 785 / 114-95) TaxID=316274 RepID=A9B0E7_HERA2|nr:hypothetical protein Haur_2618 [Herpetosiphon aurantiacus DSM 785]